MTQLIDDVLKRDEEERLRRRRIEKQIRLGMMYRRDTPFALPDAYDDHVYEYGGVDLSADMAEAAMRRNPFAAWMDAPPGLDTAEFVMPTPAWDDAEYHAAARYRAPWLSQQDRKEKTWRHPRTKPSAGSSAG